MSEAHRTNPHRSCIQKSFQIAAEAALEITGRLKLEIGLRFDGLEGGLGSLEGRGASLAAGQDSLHRAVLRIADTLIDHSARFRRDRQEPGRHRGEAAVSGASQTNVADAGAHRPDAATAASIVGR